jgi:hypothetical protein
MIAPETPCFELDNLGLPSSLIEQGHMLQTELGTYTDTRWPVATLGNRTQG